ncbi:uncharacterized protein LOC127794583 isoform X2 [Diospyros lotus]|nr:uncharacterized protein LOC127794583 isoform X2 [Diospyros lotus]XP_052181771.1 uncharacterized protein LOC127794583 isoform X2 [Diospyros lotus]
MITGFPLYPSWDTSLQEDTSFSVTKNQIKLFHEFDRDLYTILVMELWRDPTESMKVLAFWLWLERTGSRRAIKRILSLPTFLVNELADEAVTCINRLLANTPLLSFTESCDMPLTQSLMGSGHSLHFFSTNENRLKAISGVNKILEDVCLRALDDIVLRAMERNSSHFLGAERQTIPPFVADPMERNSARFFGAESQIVLPSFADPGLAELGFVEPDLPDRGLASLRVGGVDILSPRVPLCPASPEVHPDERTMFATFSKGYPVCEAEIRELFSLIFGDCIESLYMQEAPPDEQALFARIVFTSPAFVMLTLNGMEKAKFNINGKHIWLRKYVPRRQRYTAPPRHSQASMRGNPGSSSQFAG